MTRKIGNFRRMRFKIELVHKVSLPTIHYNHILQGFIYNNISDDAFRSLHDEGLKYSYETLSYLPFPESLGILKWSRGQNN